MRRTRDITTRLRRTLRHFFLVPLLRGRRHPELAARAAAVGLFWAFTPTFGVRMPLVFATWLTARYLFRIDFTLVIGLAFTWLTNAVVTLPLYFGFYLTGRLLRDGPGEVMNFQSFRLAFAPLQASEQPWLARVTQMLGDWGITLWLGALPWALIMAGIGYVTASAYLRHRRPLHRTGIQPKLGQ
jgi:uncharacterized protein (DUF2062 family)